MALISGYESDIFISYAHIDNQEADEKERGWVTLFHRHLELGLDRLIGRMHAVHVWKDDREMDGAQRFDSVIQDAIDGSAIFLALTSHGYLHPDSYCSKELQRFYEKARDDGVGLSVNGYKRIIHLLLYDIPSDKWPDPFSGATGFQFFDGEGENASPSTPGKKRFKKQLQALLTALRMILQEFPEANTTESPPPEQNLNEDVAPRIDVAVGETVTPTHEAWPGIHLKPVKARERAVLLDFHSKDQEYARSISGFLTDKGFDVLIGPDADPDADDPMSNMRIYQERLKQVGNLIIVRGDVSRDWARERFNTAFQIFIEERLPNMKFAVYATFPQRTSINLDLQNTHMVVLHTEEDVLSFLRST